MPSRPVSRRLVRAASALALGAGLSAPALLAGTASAAAPSATAKVFGQEVDYLAAPGQANKVAITSSWDTAELTYVIDDVVTISAGDGCTYPVATDHTKVSCVVTAYETEDPYAALVVSLGDGDDAATYTNTTNQAYYFSSFDLGAGKDTYTEIGRVQGNDISGGTGDDNLTVGQDTILRGGDGNDRLRAAATTIVLGGNGNDTVYVDGPGSAVEAGPGNDVIHGSTGQDSLSGDDGNDLIYGGKGNDSLYGGRGNDILYGNSGNDTLYGNSGNDKLYGGPGTDRLSGGPGRNVLHQS